MAPRSRTLCQAGAAAALVVLLGAGCVDDPPCEGQPGRFSDQSIQSSGKQRSYFLHVPSSYSCERPAALMLHFHGTVSADPALASKVRPEERWSLEGAVEVSEDRGFILVRPRARVRDFAGLKVWQWRPPGEATLNVSFTLDLLEHLGRRYHLDPARRYAAGFSNGTNMAARFLEQKLEQTFAGYGLVGGGVWGTMYRPSIPNPPPRVYAATGYRDYQLDTEARLARELAIAGHPPQSYFARKTDAGHEIYGWHVAEMFDWLDRRQRPAAGALAGAWRRDAAFSGSEDLLSLAAAGDGALLIAGSEGALYRRAKGASVWKLAARISSSAGRPALSDLCLLASGPGVAVGQGQVARTTDHGASWTSAAPVPDYYGQQATAMGSSYLLGIACAGSTVAAGGYWAGATSADGGASWSAQPFDDGAGPAMVSAVALAPSGTLVATGYGGLVARGAVGTKVAALKLPGDHTGWFSDLCHVAPDRWWVVGEGGAVLASSDDGKTWKEQSSRTTADLYAVHFWDAQLGMAVGAHGAAVLTKDGGASWKAVDTGLDGYLGDVRWTSATEALAVGASGAVLTYRHK